MKKILLVGSSIFEQWIGVERIAPGYDVVNRAVGGTVSSYWVEVLEGVFREEQPHVVLMYCGSNDLNEEVSEQDIVKNILCCRAIVDRFCPEILFGYFGIIKAPQKKGKWELIDRINGAIARGLTDDDLYVDANEVFFCERLPIAKYFVEDALHMTGAAYAKLSDYVQPRIGRWLQG